MTSVPTVGTTKDPTLGLGGAPVALGAGRRGPPLVDPHDPEPGHGGLVGEGLEEMGAAPGVGHPAVLEAPGILLGDPLGIAHDQGAHVVALRPGDHGPGRLVVGLADPATVASLGSPLRSSARMARPETSRAWVEPATAKGWMIPGSTPATSVPEHGVTGTSAVRSRTRRPASQSKVTERT